MGTAGIYGSLYQYLEHRYADIVVLTFQQMEDLLGFALPALARADPEWWTNPAPDAAGLAGYSDAWKLAHRTAVPHLGAGNVVFERVS